MKKNFPRFFKLFKSGLLLVVFLFFGFVAQAQTIGTPTISNNPYPCPGSSIEINFKVTNGSGFIISFTPFNSATNYDVILYNSSSEWTIIKSFTTNTRPGFWPGASANITEPINLPSSVPAGSGYTLKIISDNNDATSPLSTSFSIGTVAPIVGKITPPTCTKATGSVVLNGLPSGSWELTRSPGNITVTGTGPSTTISDLTAGSYTYKVKNASGCISPASENVVINTQPTSPPAPTVGTITPPTCTKATGSVTLNGLPSGSWELIRSPGNIKTTGTGTSTTISDLNAGTHTFTVTNSNGCISSSSANVVINPQPPTPSAPNIGLITPPTCTKATGSVVLNGLPPGSWELTRSPGNIKTTGTGTSTTISDLTAGSYTYTVKNASGCSSSASANVVINPQPITPTTPNIGKVTQPTCTTATGSVVLNGLPSGNWTINPGAITGSGATKTITGIEPGSYNYTVTIENGCVSSASANVVMDPPPTAPTANEIGLFNGITGKLSGTVNENQVLNLTAPAGTQFTYVDFASYGTPSNNNGDFSINENCHATTSQVISESYLLGGNDVTIPATNGVFTDPCQGTVKDLYITATYSEAFCKGTDPGTVLGSAINGSNVTYLWQISLDGPDSGFDPATGNNNQQNYNPGVLSEDIWLKRIVNSGSCSSESPVLYIPVQQENTWTGAENYNWNNMNNWSCNTLPTLKIDVVIPSGLTNYPVVNTGANALAKNLTIEAGASVTVINNWLRIAGNLTNDNKLNAVAGSISFEGSIAQTIPAGAFENDKILNLNISNSAGVTSEATIEIINSLKVEAGTFYTGDDLTLLSNETGTAYIDGSGTGEVSGTVTMQRYLSNSFGYKYFSSPFQNSTVDDLSPFFEITDPETGFPHLYEYIENRKDGEDNDLTGWQKYLDVAASLQPGLGYAINPSGAIDPLTLELAGNVNNGPIEVNLQNNQGTYTNGFNLVGNPYPSPIDWDKMIPNLQGIDNGIHFFTASADNRYTGTYTSYVDGISTDPASSIIPSMQGFFVRVSDPANAVYPASAKLQFTNASRTGNQVTHQYYKTKNKAEVPQIRLTATFKGENDTDATVIYFRNGGSPEFEKELDAQKILNTAIDVPSFYSLSSKKEKLAINAISNFSTEKIQIPLGITAERSGEMLLRLSEATNISPTLHIYLRDNKKKVLEEFGENASYSFSAQKGEIDNRFALLFTSEKLSPAQMVLATEDFSVYTLDREIVVKLNLLNNAKAKVTLSNVSGQLLQSGTGYGTEEIRFSRNFVEGIYLVTLETLQERYTKKILFKN